MTINEVEKALEIPRATIRFYEKQGLIEPQREGNGYRAYSEEDVAQLKKIIILRKIGLTINDIEDVFDGARSLSDVLDANILNLQKQIDELNGAVNLNRRLKADSAELSSFDTDRYWAMIDEEEKNGNSFFNLAKDIAEVEKKTILSYLCWTDKNGNPYDLPKGILYFILVMCAIGCICCLTSRQWSLEIFMSGLKWTLGIMLLECLFNIPMHFLGKKYPWITRNKVKILIISALLFCVLLIIAANL